MSCSSSQHPPMLARLGAMIAVTAATLAAAGVAPVLLPSLLRATPAPAAPADDGAVRMNQIQFIGVHNAYHRELQGAELAAVTRTDPTYPSWGGYSHASLPDQLARQRVRGIELDVYPDPAGGLYQYPLARRAAGLGPVDDPNLAKPGMKVMHIADADYGTSCRTLVACLEQVRTWSRANPKHIPIIMQLELKSTSDAVEQLGGAVSPDWDSALLDDLDEEIRAVFCDEELITPDDLRKPGLTLEESILGHGWPTLGWARGKVMFFFDNGGPGAIRTAYTAGRPNLEGRAVFTQGNPGDPDAAITMVNDPRGGNEAIIRDLVSRGYLVRTRADEPLTTVKSQEFGRVATALASGAQLVTTDFPTVGMAARYDSDFVAELPGGAVARCNPVSAPRRCQDASLERR